MEPDRQMQKQRDQIEKVRVFPMKNLERLMRQTVPDAKLAEDFKEVLNFVLNSTRLVNIYSLSMSVQLNLLGSLSVSM